jgi:tetratricopeptide (TPR) repeat protein
MTGNRVPRWFTEGLSVHEEHRARPGWGDDVTVDFVRALKAGELLPLGDLNRGFIRPKGPEQVANSYYQASLVVEWIEAQRGFPALLALLKAYGEGRSTEEAFPAVLGTSLEDFDKAFFAQLEQRFAGPLAAVRPATRISAPGLGAIPARTSSADVEARAKADPGDFEAQLAAGLALFHASKRAEALPYFERAQALFPEFAGRESPHFYLAAIYKDQGKPLDAIRELQQLTAIADGHYRGQLELARLPRGPGRPERGGRLPAIARSTSRRSRPPSTRSWPRSPRGSEDRAGVVRARRALVALDPVDRPEALYQLALALLEPAMRRRPGARCCTRWRSRRVSSAPRSCCCASTTPRRGAPLNEDGGAARARPRGGRRLRGRGRLRSSRRGVQEHAVQRALHVRARPLPAFRLGARAGTCGAWT